MKKGTPDIIKIVAEQQSGLPEHIGLIAIAYSLDSDEMTYTSTADKALTEYLLESALDDLRNGCTPNPHTFIA